MKRLRALLRAFLNGGGRCPFCNVVSPHRSPHQRDCDWYRYDQSTLR